MKGFFKWLPYVCSYNKRLMALSKLTSLDKNVNSQNDDFSGITHRVGILTKNDIGYHEFLDIIKTEVLGSLGEIIYEQIERPTGKFNAAIGQEIELLTRLQVKIGDKLIVIKGIDLYEPTKIITDLRESIKLKLWEVIGTITFGGSIILFFLTLTFAILKIAGVIK